MGNEASGLCCLSSHYMYSNSHQSVPGEQNFPTGGEFDRDFCYQKQQQKDNVTPLRNNIISSQQDCNRYNRHQYNADLYQPRDQQSRRVVTPSVTPPLPQQQQYGYGTPEPLLVTLTPTQFFFASTPPPRSDHPPSKIADSSNFSISSISADSDCDFSIRNDDHPNYNNNNNKSTYLTLDEMRNDEARRPSIISHQDDERINATMSGGSAANSVGGDDGTTFTNTNMLPFHDAVVEHHRNTVTTRGS